MTSRTVVAGIVALEALLSYRLLDAQTLTLEVTQGIQYFDPGTTTKHNSIPLVAARRTAVRTMVEGIDPATVAEVSGKLSLSGTTETLLADNASDFTKFFTDNKASTLKNTNGTLNFRVDSFPGTKNQTFTVSIAMKLTDNTTKTVTKDATLNVVTVHPLEIRLVPVILVSKSGSVFGPPDREELETELLELVEGCFPIKVPDTQFTWQPSMTVIEDTKKGCASIIDDAEKGKSEVDRTLSELNSNYNPSDDKNVIVYGLVSPTPSGGPTIGDEYCWPTLGWANCDKRSAFGTAAPPYSPKAFAHELGHLLTLKHCDCPDTPDTCDMQGQVPFDVQTMSVVPEPYTSFMTCGGVDDKSVWATPQNYIDMLAVLKEGSGGGITFCNTGRIKEPKEKREKKGPQGKGN